MKRSEVQGSQRHSRFKLRKSASIKWTLKIFTATEDKRHYINIWFSKTTPKSHSKQTHLLIRLRDLLGFDHCSSEALVNIFRSTPLKLPTYELGWFIEHVTSCSDKWQVKGEVRKICCLRDYVSRAFFEKENPFVMFLTAFFVSSKVEILKFQLIYFLRSSKKSELPF